MIGRGVKQGCCLSLTLFNLNSEHLNKEAVEKFGDIKVGGQVISTAKYADKLVVLAKEEVVVWVMIDTQNKFEAANGNECGKN
jgi:hypothetical protein